MSYTKPRSLRADAHSAGRKVPKAEFDVANMEFKFHFHPEAYGFMDKSVYALVVPYNADDKEPMPHMWATWNVTKDDLVLIRDTLNSALEWL